MEKDSKEVLGNIFKVIPEQITRDSNVEVLEIFLGIFFKISFVKPLEDLIEESLVEVLERSLYKSLKLFQM